MDITAAVRAQARDLRTEFPRSPRETLGGYVLAARAVDKCRASLCGINGDYNYNCPLDQLFFAFAGLTSEAFRAIVATGASDREVEAWIVENATRHSSEDILAWNTKTGPQFRHLDLEEGRV